MEVAFYVAPLVQLQLGQEDIGAVLGRGPHRVAPRTGVFCEPMSLIPKDGRNKEGPGFNENQGIYSL